MRKMSMKKDIKIMYYQKIKKEKNICKSKSGINKKR